MTKNVNSAPGAAPLVGIIMGSDSDFGTMKLSADALVEFGVPHEVRVVSAHRTPDDMARYAKEAAARGLKVVIAGAGGAAHLPGMVASFTSLPVIGVPIETQSLRGLDSLYSIVQMPAGVPVATVGIANGRNAGLLAVRMLAAHDAGLRARYEAAMAAQAELSRRKNDKLQDLLRQG
ncbi:MAG: 5-(carboxyamino)imidazole ribonucleotide mutase [Planctomycetes bacterium]|nr:5-(carboxyamino)imidazole ribonucleotide mutase [Planctomycetota bacterium]